MNTNPTIGQLVAGKNNTYEVVKIIIDGNCKFITLRCVDFYDTDNLGDGIMCDALDEEIMIANFNFQHMPVL